MGGEAETLIVDLAVAEVQEEKPPRIPRKQRPDEGDEPEDYFPSVKPSGISVNVSHELPKLEYRVVNGSNEIALGDVREFFRRVQLWKMNTTGQYESEGYCKRGSHLESNRFGCVGIGQTRVSCMWPERSHHEELYLQGSSICK